MVHPAPARPRYSVVIPTRERCDTLAWTLKTCTTQDHDSLEIIVSDNHSADRTEEVVRAAGDPRVRYVHTGRRLSMTDNFEFGLSHARGEYVMFLGDDDGLLPDALDNLAIVVDATRCPAIVWPLALYYWPGYIDPQLANTLIMDPDQRPAARPVSPPAMLREVAAFRARYTTLPSPYFGFVRRDAIESVRQRSGRFFHSIIPDIYSGVALAATLDSYHVSSWAYSLAGQSRHSNGASTVSGRAERDGASEGARFQRENTLPFHPAIDYTPSIPLYVAESFFQARDHVGGDRLVIAMRDVIDAALADINVLVNPTLQRIVADAIRRTSAQHGLADYADAAIRRARLLRYPRMLQEVARSIVVNDPIFDCARHGARNVYDATHICAELQRQFQSPPVRFRATLQARADKARRVAAAGLGRLWPAGQGARDARARS